MGQGLLSRVVAGLRNLPAALAFAGQPDDLQRALHDAIPPRPTRSPARPVLAVEAVESTFHFGLFGQIVTSLRDRVPLRAHMLVTRSLSVGETHSLVRFLNARLVGRRVSTKWRCLYSRFCDTTAYDSCRGHLFSDMVDLVRALMLKSRLRDRRQLLDLAIDGVPVGDLVNDSHLRFAPAATLEVRDWRLVLPLWQALRELRRARAYFSTHKPDLYLASSAVYVQHGIAARVALQAGVPVMSFGSFQDFYKALSLGDWLDTRDASGYAEEFRKVEDPAAALAQAQAALEHRIGGGIDPATGYMTRSAYGATVDLPDVRGSAIVFLHDFYDSPHIYHDMVFPDFWEWICFTIETLQESGLPFHLKPHPNQIPLSESVLARLRQKYAGLQVLPSASSNKALADAGIRCGVTVYGTVAHELAFLGIPSIACARHPHTSFSFCVTARNRADYAAALVAPAFANFSPSEAMQQSLQFYYMHNCNLAPDEIALRDAVLDVRRQCTFPDASREPLERQFAGLSRFEAYRRFIDGCARHLEGNAA